MILRLVPAHGRDLDVMATQALPLTLTRGPEGCFLEVPDDDVARLVGVLAYAGIAATPDAIDLGTPPAAIPATAGDLRPAPAELVIRDTVRIRPLPLGMATSEVLRRRFASFRAPSPAAQVRCRRLLRGQDVVFAWRRQAWVQRASVRELRRRSSLRPAIFDRGALAAGARERRAFASEGALARWAFS